MVVAEPVGSAATSRARIERAGRVGRRRVSGSIIVSGSSTVEPISTGVAESFAEANPGFSTPIEGPGTGDGFKRFCEGETDISDASRKIKHEEAEACTAGGIEYVELKDRVRRHDGHDEPGNTGDHLPLPSPTCTP